VVIHNNDPLDLAGNEGEVISVAIARSKANVDLLVNGQVFTQNTLTLRRADGDPVHLAVGGVFTDRTNGGGAFSVSLTGGGITATKAISQVSPREARRSFVFTIDIV